MSTTEPPPDARQVVDDLEDDVVDLDRLKADESERGPASDVESAADDGSREVPGTPEPPD
jgi:hypothetical protein